ncbi:MAG TPA: cytochrome c3 family protein [Anaeromyxobacteraceae bacterium]|nr:cytochrome c3 family protein [Anaeromyxobacteraceae bacterium]
MLRLAAAALASLFLAAAASAAPPPKSMTFPAKSGVVSFEHELHAKRAGSCKACHPAAPAKLAGKDAAHKLCLECHKEKKAGPTKCGDCHKKA